MAGVNKAILIGHLGADPQVRTTQSGAPVVSFRMATSETWRDKASGERKEATQWHSVVVFNEALGKVAEQYLKKGSKVYVEGLIATRKWTGQDGIDRWTTEIVLKGFQGQIVLLDRAERAPPPDESSYAASSPSQRVAPDASPMTSSVRSDAAKNPIGEDLNDEIPF